MSHPTDDKEPIRSESDSGPGGESRAGSSAQEKPRTSETGSQQSRAADAAAGGETTGKAGTPGEADPDEEGGAPTEALERVARDSGVESAAGDASAADIPSGVGTESGSSAAKQVGALDSVDGEPAEAAARGSEADTEPAVPVAESGAGSGEETARSQDAGSDEKPAAAAADSSSIEVAPAEESGAQAPTAGPEAEQVAAGSQAAAGTAAELAEPVGNAAETPAASIDDAEGSAASIGAVETAAAGTAASAGAAEEDAVSADGPKEPAASDAAAGPREDATAEITASGVGPGPEAAEEPANEVAAAGTDEGTAAAEQALVESADTGAATERGDAATTDPTVELAAPTGTEAKTVVIPRPQRPEEAPTESISVRKPDPNATERIDMSQVRSPGRPEPKQSGGPQGPARTDRVGPGAVGPLSKPPNTPRPQSGPKRPGLQAPSRPDQSAPPRPGGSAPASQGVGVPQGAPRPAGDSGRPQAGAQRPAGAPSPADIKPTVAEHRVAQSPQYGAPGQIAQPQRVEPTAAPAGSAGKRKWLIAAGAAVVVVIAAIAVVVGVGSGDDSPQARIRMAIGDYTGALENGDLAGLRDTTCGGLHDYYQGLSEEQFAAVHQQAVDGGSIPDVTGVDAVQITDRTALAQVTVQTEADSAQTTRTFDLQETDDGWKVCDPPADTP